LAILHQEVLSELPFFQKDVVSAVGGNLAVLPADLLNTTMSADDEDDDFVRVTTTGDTRVTTTGDIRVEAGYGTLTIEGNESFSSGDIIRIKDGARDEWMEIKGNLPPLLSMEFSETKLEFMLTVQIRNGQRAQRW